MNNYQKYQHLEKLGSDEVDGILFGTCYVFPKIDGTNAHVWREDGVVKFGSRNRELSLENDNAGFMAWGVTHDWSDLKEGMHVFGEWLVPHSLKTYRDDAWRKFYVFDIFLDGEYCPFDTVEHYADLLGLEFIQPLRIIKNPKFENIEQCLEENKYLIKEGEGIGEGVVIKNYDFVNKFGRQCWAKMVTNQFKEKHVKAMGAPESTGTKYIEEEIANEYVDLHLVEKTYAKIALDGWNSKKIPHLLGVVWHDLITESMWDIVKSNKNPAIDFKVLNRFVIARIKQLKPEIF